MMGDLFTLLGSILDIRVIGLALSLIAMVLVAGYFISRNAKARKQKPGQYLTYVALGQTAASCRALLKEKGETDIFTYTLEPSNQGGVYIKLEQHRPTQQQLATVYLLVFENEAPARFTLQFISEAFGMREPVVPEALVDEFFTQKLGAQRVAGDLPA